MMKQIVLIFCMAFSIQLYVFGQGYTISGEIKGSADGQTVTLRQISNLQPVEIATTTVKDGKFSFTGSSPYPEFCMLFVGENGPLQFFVENSDISILVDLENMGQSKVTGSKENDIFMEFWDGLEKFAIQQKQIEELSTSSIVAPELDIQMQLEKLNIERTNFAINFVLTNSGKITAAFLLCSINGLIQMFDILQIEQVVKGYDAISSQSQWVKMLSAHIAQAKQPPAPLDVGQPFADITLKSPDDQPVSISDYVGNSKYVLLDFWASWCGPCRMANPRLVGLYEQYKDKGFEIIGISLDSNKEHWVKAIKDDKLTWAHMSDLKHWRSDAAKLYSVNAIPHMILLDKNGIIIAKGLHIETLKAKLEELLSN